MTGPEHPAITAGAGPAVILAGLALLAQELGLVVPDWSLVLPLLLVAVGVVTAVGGALGAHRDHRP